MDIATIALIVSLIVGMGTAAAVIGGSWRIGRINRYREEAELWEQRANRFEADSRDLKTQNSRQAEQISSLQAQVDTLKDVVTGKSAIEALGTAMANYTSQMMAQMEILSRGIATNNDLLNRILAGEES